MGKREERGKRENFSLISFFFFHSTKTGTLRGLKKAPFSKISKSFARGWRPKLWPIAVQLWVFDLVINGDNNTGNKEKVDRKTRGSKFKIFFPIFPAKMAKI